MRYFNLFSNFPKKTTKIHFWHNIPYILVWFTR